MFEELLFSFQLRQLQARQHRLVAKWIKKFNWRGKTSKTQGLCARRNIESSITDQEFDGEIKQLQTRHLIPLSTEAIRLYAVLKILTQE
jgi:hypothetical protein